MYDFPEPEKGIYKYKQKEKGKCMMANIINDLRK